MFKNNIFFILLLLLVSCNTDKKLSNDDYEILQIVIGKYIVSRYENDDALKKYKKGTEEYRNRMVDLIDKQNYESTYYYTLDDSLFSYKQNRFIKGLFLEYGFDRDIPNNMTSQKFDFSKIKTKKNLIRININSPLVKSENYTGDFKISRILYYGDKATVILVEKGNKEKRNDGGRGILFLKKENEKWEVYKTMGIPFKYYDEEIEL